jgi:hypothetical protein
VWKLDHWYGSNNNNASTRVWINNPEASAGCFAWHDHLDNRYEKELTLESPVTPVPEVRTIKFKEITNINSRSGKWVKLTRFNDENFIQHLSGNYWYTPVKNVNGTLVANRFEISEFEDAYTGNGILKAFDPNLTKNNEIWYKIPDNLISNKTSHYSIKTESTLITKYNNLTNGDKNTIQNMIYIFDGNTPSSDIQTTEQINRIKNEEQF